MKKIKGQFDCTAFVFASERPHMKNILLDLLSELGTTGNMWDDERQLIKKIGNFSTTRGTFADTMICQLHKQ